MGFHYRWFDRDQEKMDEMGIPLTRAQIDERERAQEPQRLFSRGEHGTDLRLRVDTGRHGSRLLLSVLPHLRAAQNRSTFFRRLRQEHRERHAGL